MSRELTEDVQFDRDQFEAEHRNHGCTCFISPPCSHCTHPGHPLNQEDDDCWTDAAQVADTPADQPAEGK